MNKNPFWQYIVGVIAITLWIPNIASAYTRDGFGFIVSTTLLHLAGIGMRLAIDRYQPKLQQLLFQIGGGATAIGAIYVLVNH